MVILGVIRRIISSGLNLAGAGVGHTLWHHMAMSHFEAAQGLTEEGAPGLAVTGLLCGAPLPELTVLSGRAPLLPPTLGYAMHLHWTQSKRDTAK